MVYTLGNKRAKNLCKLIVLSQLIIENVVTFFESVFAYTVKLHYCEPGYSRHSVYTDFFPAPGRVPSNVR